MKKRFLALLLTGALTLTAFTACSSKSESADAGSAEAGDEAAEVITVAASPTPHAEILEQAKAILADEGYDLQVTVFDDYIQPNAVVESGEIDANYFQHQPYLDDFNAQNGTHIVSVAGIHVEPMGLYGGKQTSLDAITAE